MTTMTTILVANRDSRSYQRPQATCCGGDGCIDQDAWPIYHVRHRGVFCRLCTSCVLKYHPGSFCTNCFELIDGSQPPGRHDPVMHCSSCPSISHTKCLPDAQQASCYICPCCANPNGFSYFPVSRGSTRKDARVSDAEEANPTDGWQTTITLEYAKVFLAAARLASASMRRAVLATRIEAEKKSKESVLAQKRAREALDLLFERSKALCRQKPPGLEVDELKKMTLAKPGSVLSAAVPTPSRMQNMERERWMKVHSPIPLAQRSPVKPPVTGSLSSQIPHHPNHIGLEVKGEVGSFPASQRSFAGEEKESSKVSTDPETAPQMPPSRQAESQC